MEHRWAALDKRILSPPGQPKSRLSRFASAAGLGDFIKSVTPQSEDRSLACVLLPAPNRYIDVPWVKLDRSSASTCLFRGDQNSSAAAKGIENETTSPGAILDRVGNHRYRLYGRMHGQFVQTSGSHGIHTIVIPHVCAMRPY